jgi:head-tail adaptor
VKEGVRLSRRLVLEEAERVADGSGGYGEDWRPLGVLWADVRPRGGREDFVAGRPRPRVSYRVLVRAAPVGAPSRPRPQQRLRDGARVLRILTVTEGDPAGRYLEIIAEEGLLP